MTTTAKSIIQRAAVDNLQDAAAVRWATAELVRYLNDGQREIVMYRPDAKATNTTFDCVAGSRQTLAATTAKLIDVVRNAATSSNKRAVRVVDRTLLDTQIPNWHNVAASINIRHVVFDPRDPRVFYTYPPALNTAKLDIVHAPYPQAIAEPADGTIYSDVTGNIDVPDIFAGVLLDYVLYRAYSKDSEFAANQARADDHYNKFLAGLGVEVRATVGVEPGNRDGFRQMLSVTAAQ